MSTLSVRIRYRPVRFGLCVRNGNLQDVEKVLRLTHTLWGGRYNPLIPVGNDSLSRELVELFRVDALFNAVDAPELRAFEESYPHLRWPSLHKGLFIDGWGNEKVSTFLDIYHPLRKIYEDHVKDKTYPTALVKLFEWEADDPLSNCLLAYLGGYPQNDESRDYTSSILQELKGSRIKVERDDAVPFDAFKSLTPNGITAYHLQRDASPGRNHRGVYVGDASDFDDIVNFWNIRAAGIGVVFFDAKYDSRMRPLVDHYLERLRGQLKGPDDWGSAPGLWYKEGSKIDGAPVDGLRFHIEMREGIWNGLNLTAPAMYIDDDSALASVSDTPGRKSLSFELRNKPFYSDFRLHNQQVVVSVSPLIDIRDDETTFRYPYLPQLNEYYGREAYFEYDSARSEPERLGLIVDVTRPDLTLHSLQKRDLVSRIFEVAGIKAVSSEAGRIASRLIQQMGGAQGCRVFKIAGVRDLIKRYGPLQPFTRSAAIQIIGNNDPQTGRPRFESYERLYIAPRDRGALTPMHVFDYLLANNVFRVGLTIHCPNCDLEFWTSLDDSKVMLTCEYCGHLINTGPQLKDRDWKYRRSGLFGRSDDQQGSIPVALTMQQLDTAISHDGLMVTAMNLEPITADVEACETDFVVVTDESYRRDLAIGIGECKSYGEITTEDVRKLTRVAEALSKVNRIEPYIIFSKTSSFSHEEIDRCRAAQGRFRKRVILLSARELEPYFMYELTEKEFEVQRSAISLMDMASITHDVFFEPKPKNNSNWS